MSCHNIKHFGGNDFQPCFKGHRSVIILVREGFREFHTWVAVLREQNLYMFVLKGGTWYQIVVTPSSSIVSHVLVSQGTVGIECKTTFTILNIIIPISIA